MNVDKLLVEAGAYFGGDGVNYDRFEPRKFAALVLATTPPQPEQELVGYWKEHAQGMQRDYDLLLADYEKLAQPEQKPVVTKNEKGLTLHVGWDDLPAGTKLYTLPQRTWVGLTDEERLEAAEIDGANEGFWIVCKAIEAKLKDKNCAG